MCNQEFHKNYLSSSLDTSLHYVSFSTAKLLSEMRYVGLLVDILTAKNKLKERFIISESSLTKMIVILLPLTILVLLLLLFYFAMKTSNFKKFYFTIVAIAGIIGMVVAYGMAAYQILMLNIISDQEYIQGSRYWEIQDCQYRTTAKPLVAPTDGQAVDMAPTEQEIDACEREATARAITSRKYNAKEVIIGGLVRGTIFLILYKLHYPHMVAEEPTTPDKPKRTTRKTPTRRRSTRKTVAKNS